MKYLSSLKQADQFGIIFFLFVSGNSDDKYKSILGAFQQQQYTYLMILWTTDQIPPIIVSQTKFMQDGSTFELWKSPFQFNIEAYGQEVFEKLKSKTFYIIDGSMYYDEEYHDTSNISLNCSNVKIPYIWDLNMPVCVDLHYEGIFEKKYYSRQINAILQRIKRMKSIQDMNQGLVMETVNYKKNSYFKDPNCVNEDEGDIIFEDNTGKITILTEEYDYDSGELITLPKDFYFPLSTKLYNQFYMDLTITRLTISRGILFPSTISKSFISKVSVQNSVTSREKGTLYAAFWLSLEKVETELKIEYPKLPEILAQFSSIFNGLLTFGIIVSLINSYLMKLTLINNLGEIYFFNYQSFIETKKLKKKERRNNKLISTEIEILKSELQKKFNIINLVYEVSKLQLAIQTILTTPEIEEIQKLKYQLVDDNKFVQNEVHLTQKEMFIFSEKNENWKNQSLNYQLQQHYQQKIANKIIPIDQLDGFLENNDKNEN